MEECCTCLICGTQSWIITEENIRCSKCGKSYRVFEDSMAKDLVRLINDKKPVSTPNDTVSELEIIKAQLSLSAEREERYRKALEEIAKPDHWENSATTERRMIARTALDEGKDIDDALKGGKDDPILGCQSTPVTREELAEEIRKIGMAIVVEQISKPPSDVMAGLLLSKYKIERKP